MRKKIMQLLVLCASAFTVHAQVATGYQVGTWYGYKTAAVSYTFDGYSATSKQVTVAVPLFDQYSFKVTITAITSWISNWSPLVTCAASGHEIASLTVTHNSLASQSVASQQGELSQSQTIINNNITSQKCVSLAYPYCDIGDLATVQMYYINGRTCSGVIEPSTPANLYSISSSIIGANGTSTGAGMDTKVASAKSSGGWCVFLIHGIDGDGGYSNMSSTELGTHLSYMNASAADFWVGTFGNVTRYIRERNAAGITETTITSDSLKMVLTDNLDNTIYDQALTIRRLLPTGWEGARVYLGDSLISSTSVTSGGNTYVQFDAVPDAGDVFLANSAPAAVVLAPTVTSPVAYCQGDVATALTATGTSLKWYTVATGGTELPVAPTPPTAVADTIYYYVSQTVGGTESPRSKITVIIAATPPAPGVSSPVNYVQFSPANQLEATGMDLKWYVVATGGTASSIAPTPGTSIVGTTSYFVSQAINSCESPRATIDVVIGAAPVVDLVAGWNIIGCPLYGNPSLESALSSIWAEVESVKSQDAFYATGNTSAFNSLSAMSWGQGYMVKVKSACSLNWALK